MLRHNRAYQFSTLGSNGAADYRSFGYVDLNRQIVDPQAGCAVVQAGLELCVKRTGAVSDARNRAGSASYLVEGVGLPVEIAAIARIPGKCVAAVGVIWQYVDGVNQET
jgi:hypothetical protein